MEHVPGQALGMDPDERWVSGQHATAEHDRFLDGFPASSFKSIDPELTKRVGKSASATFRRRNVEEICIAKVLLGVSKPIIIVDWRLASCR